MTEREIISISPIDEDEWGESVMCMDPECEKSAEKEFAVTYEREDDKTFYTCLCPNHSSAYESEYDRKI